METAMIPANTPDIQVIAMWLHGRSPHTQRAYQKDVRRFHAFIGHPITATTLGDLQAFIDSLDDLAPSSRGRAVAAWLPQTRESLAERIISEAAVHRMIGMEDHPRDRTLLKLLYASGIRVSELCGLRWRDLQEREYGGQITVYGKGSKTRAVVIPESVWTDVMELREGTEADDAVFRSARGGGPLTSGQVWRIVKRAAVRAGLGPAVSPHFLRHAHASHSLDRGAPIHLVQTTLGHSSVATTGRYTHARPGESSGRYLAV